MIESLAPLLDWSDVAPRFLLTVALAGIIGMEREFRHKPAGLVTNIMVGLGSTLFTIVSVEAARMGGMAGDPTRIAAQIVSGIGFLGVGTILYEKDRTSVTGLTTAATLWVVAAVGMAVGMGMYAEAVVTTIVVFFTFLVLGRVVSAVRQKTDGNSHEHQESAQN